MSLLSFDCSYEELEVRMRANQRTKDIRDIVHKLTGITVKLRLDTQELLYRATFADQMFSSKNGDEVVAQVLQAIERSLQVVWVPVIEVRPYAHTFTGPATEDVFAFTFDRLYVAEFPDGSYKQVQWGTTEKDRLLFSRTFSWSKGKTGLFSPPCACREFSDVRHYLPYSDGAYEGLRLIQEQIRKLRVQFLEILGSQEGIDWLSTLTAAVPPLALAAPAVESRPIEK